MAGKTLKSTKVAQETSTDWTFLSNHAHVLVSIARDPEIRLSEIAQLVGIGERAVHSIVNDLVEAGYVVRHKRGRNNHYEVDLDRPLRHPLESDSLVAEIVRPLTRRTTTTAARPRRR
jgi:MarR family